ncbi:MAG: chromosome segregation protein SMC [Aquabacterium sp.]
MRLSQIKLAGFKSFADPTTFQLPGQRVGVVGPNGCGKSNIIDAVRWVLGESKASELRGESMQDVIFNGSTSRKPAARASVELVFDNSAARAGGPWNQYAELAVRRVLTRDGTSSYFINNQPVRRRDVQDVFLGTGLGPRAYAIIGQGTISRIIESRPEELRLFLEEAAGVSKYKERRRETENRIKDTRENLTRVDDILRELGSNLARLEQQAEVAQQYRALQERGALRLHQLWFLKHRDAAGEATRVQKAVDEAVNALEGRVAELRHLEAAQEQRRQGHYEQGQALHFAQGALAEAALELTRIEDRIRHVADSRQRVQQRIAELTAQTRQWDQQRGQAETELAEVAVRIEATQEQADLLAAQAEEAQGGLPEIEAAWRSAQAQANDQQRAASAVSQQIQLGAAESRHVDEQRRQVMSRLERLQGEGRQLSAPDMVRLGDVAERIGVAETQRDEADARLHELQERAPALEDERREQAARAQADAQRLAELAARGQALRALQEKVQTEGKLKPWLARHGLEGLQGLWTRLHVEAGWEPALEAALRERLGAVEIQRLEMVRAFATDAPPARLAFYSLQDNPPPASAGNGLPRLADLVRLPAESAGLRALLADWLEGAYTAASFDEALARRARLAHGEIIVTREGHAVSRSAVSFYAPDSEQAGLLARAQEIENLERAHRAQGLIADESRTMLVRLEAACSDIQQQLAQARRQAAEAQGIAHRLQMEHQQLRQQADAAVARRQQLDAEQADLQGQLEALDARRDEAEGRLASLDEDLADAQQRHADLEDAAIRAERGLADARTQLRALETRAQEFRFEARALTARSAELQRLIDTAQAQVRGNADSGAQMEMELGQLDSAAAQSGLQGALELKLTRETELVAQRAHYDEGAAAMRQGDEQRLALEQSLEPQRARITQLQLELQAAQLGGAQYLEQLQAAQVDLEALAAGVEQERVRLTGLQAEIDRINRDINDLGAVNLAALEELTTARERKTFLDAQSADLNEAMQTLQDAIHKIDLETRDLLKQTFDQVNEHFGRMFPSLFGGGTARLQMTGDEILDAGVQVLAQPPGKKNSSIHLLSGGEKALTAIALVFAIFMLNPAPFCLLDEVDAPLDDANTERYGRLVTEMSTKGTQFLFISHNKITMEISEQLIGVTMQEQGVSRIVAVDIAEAVHLAEAA